MLPTAELRQKAFILWEREEYVGSSAKLKIMRNKDQFFVLADFSFYIIVFKLDLKTCISGKGLIIFH